ncbi:MAG TPA: class I SAM-dependent methyltransferase [Candidatus Binatia bacterium]
MPWEVFDREATTYEQWYRSKRGERADRSERALLKWLLTQFPSPRTIVEVGCGTGHFTAALASMGLRVVGLERAPGMAAEMARDQKLPVIVGDAHRLPFREGAVDIAAFVTTLEFLEKPEVAVSEAARIARQGVILIVLNRWSLGGLSRRFGGGSRGHLLRQAKDYSLGSIKALVEKVLGPRIQTMGWTSTLFPNGFWRLQAPLPLGDVIGIAVVVSRGDTRAR